MGDDHYGIWLSILEKAYANRLGRRTEKTDAANEPSSTVPRDFLGGGRPGPVIEQLTGHKADGIPLTSSANEDLPATVQHIHELLMKLTRERRLVATGTSKNAKLPPKIPHGHVFGVAAHTSPLNRLSGCLILQGKTARFHACRAARCDEWLSYARWVLFADMLLSEFVQTFTAL